MATAIQPKITNAGLAAAQNAKANGLELELTHIALGTGKYTPTYGQTALVGYKERAAINASAPKGTDGFQVSATFPEWTQAAYAVGEIGIYAGDPQAGGVLFAVYSSTATLVTRSAVAYVVSMALRLARVPEDSVVVSVDTDLGVAATLIAAHIAQADPHPQYLKESEADSAYLKKADAAQIYLTKDEAEETYLTEVSAADALYAGRAVKALIQHAGQTYNTADPTGLYKAIFDLVMPVGHILHRYDATNPNTLYPSTTWARIAVGRMLIGQNESDGMFDTPGEVGGSKTKTLLLEHLPPHSHTVSFWDPDDATHQRVGGTGLDSSVQKTQATSSTGGGQPFDVMPPYQVVVIWRRTA